MPTQKDEPYFDVYPSHRGGHTTVYGGYVWELVPHHPLANRWGYVAQHRLIGEELAGRPLVQGADPEVRECVHHKDENRLNNSRDNLQVMTFSAHRRHHTHQRNVRAFQTRIPMRAEVSAALSATPTIRDAAATVGVCHHTLRKHFPDLVAPYARRKPTKPFAPSAEQLAMLRELAADSTQGSKSAAKRLGVSEKTMQKMCLHFGIVWVRKSRKGEVQRRGTPTRRWLEVCASPTGSDSPR